MFYSIIVVMIGLLNKAGNFTTSFGLAICLPLLPLLSAGRISASLTPTASLYGARYLSQSILSSNLLEAKDLLNTEHF